MQAYREIKLRMSVASFTTSFMLLSITNNYNCNHQLYFKQIIDIHVTN